MSTPQSLYGQPVPAGRSICVGSDDARHSLRRVGHRPLWALSVIAAPPQGRALPDSRIDPIRTPGFRDECDQVVKALVSWMVTHPAPDLDTGLRKCRAHPCLMTGRDEAIAIPPDRGHGPTEPRATTMERLRRPPGVGDGPDRLPGAVDEVSPTGGHSLHEVGGRQPTVCHDGYVAPGPDGPAGQAPRARRV